VAVNGFAVVGNRRRTSQKSGGGKKAVSKSRGKKPARGCLFPLGKEGLGVFEKGTGPWVPPKDKWNLARTPRCQGVGKKLTGEEVLGT